MIANLADLDAFVERHVLEEFDHRSLNELITEAPRHLTARGVLQIVVQRRVPVLPLLRQRFARVGVAEQTEGYRVVRAER